MDAYYYSFNHTGSNVVDGILSAVACAGKAFHNTSEWNDEIEWDNNKTPVEKIQEAAERTAKYIAKLEAKAGIQNT